MNMPTSNFSKPIPHRAVILAALALLLCLFAFIGFKYHEKNARLRDTAAFKELALNLSQVIRAESPEPSRMGEAEKKLAELKAAPPQGPATGQLALGAEAYMAERLKEADDSFIAAAVLMPDSPDLFSFQAATNLRLGNTAKAEELYIRALALKSGAGYDSLLLTPDQLGLALCLFLLHRADEALPLAEQAWDLRRRQLGPASSDTVSAANRLATIYVALTKEEEAEALLKQSYLDALVDAEANAVVLEEARLFLQTIAKSSERAAEMEEFFAQAQQQAMEEASLDAPPVEESDPITEEDLAQWDELAKQMRGYDDALAADLLVRLIIGRQAVFGLDLYHPDLRPIHLELVRAYMDSAQFNAAEEELRPLISSVADRQSEEFLELSTLMANIQEGAGRYEDAEAEWFAAAEVLDTQVAAAVKTREGAAPLLVSRMLKLHIKIAENLLKQGKAAAEAELELRAALGRLNPRLLSTYPGAAEIYLRLARLLKDAEKRARDSADYYRRAKRTAETVLKRSPEPEIKAEMETLLAAVATETKPRKKNQEEPTDSAPPASEAPLPEPEMLRQELSALAALDRLSEFQPRVESVLAEAASRYGDGSPTYLRYYTLKLKGLEEEGRVEELTDELIAQAARPRGRTPAEEALVRGSALTYAARANEAAGHADKAMELYREALTALTGQTKEPAPTRRRAIEEALAALQQTKLQNVSPQ